MDDDNEFPAILVLDLELRASARGYGLWVGESVEENISSMTGGALHR